MLTDPSVQPTNDGMRNLFIFFVVGFLNNEHVHMVPFELKLPNHGVEDEETAEWSDLARMRRRSGGAAKKVPVVRTTTVDPVPRDPEPYAPIMIGCILGGIIVFVAFMGVLIYLRTKKEENTISLQSISEKTVTAPPKSAQQFNQSLGDDLGSKSIEKKKGPETVGSVEDDKKMDKRKPRKVATVTDLEAQKRHKDYVNARNKEHAEDTKSSRFQKKRNIFIPNEIDDEAFAENPKAPVVKLQKVYYNSKENEQYDLCSDLEELEMESAGMGSSAESVMTAHLSGKVSRITNKTAKITKAKKVPSVSNVPASSAPEPSAPSFTNPSTNHSTAPVSNEAHAQPNALDPSNLSKKT